MEKRFTCISIVLLMVCLCTSSVLAQQEFIRSENIDASILPEEILTETTVLDQGYGIFENAAALVYTEGRIRGANDQTSLAPSIQYDEQTGEYLIYSNGNDVWDNEDATAYLWTTRPGSHRMTVRVRWINEGGNAWAKAGIMSRLDPTNNASPHFFFQFRGEEDGTEVGHRNWPLAPTTQNLYDMDAHENTVFLGPNTLEPILLRVTRIWPSNQLIFEDSDPITLEDLGMWDMPETMFATLPLPYEMNWGIWGFDHVPVSSATFPDAALIDNVVLEPIVGGNRILSESHFMAETPMDVTLLLNNPGDPADADVTELVPEGWAISNISDGGSSAGNTITWSLSGVQGDQELSYTITPPADAQSGEFSGDVNGIMTAGPRLVGLAPEMGSSIGGFDGVSNIGGADGSVEFADDAYTITTSGTVGGLEDSLNFVWKRVTGDFNLKARFDPFGSDSARHGFMIRDSLASNASFIFINLSPIFEVRMQSRDVAGNDAYAHRAATWYEGTLQRNGWEFPGDNVTGVLQMERIDGQVVVSFEDLLQPAEDLMTVYGAGSIVGSDPVYIGIAASSGSDVADGDVTVNEVEIVGDDTSVADWSLF